MKAGTHQTDPLLRIVIVGEVGISAMPRNRVRKMVRLISIDHTLSTSVPAATLSGGDRPTGLITTNQAVDTSG
ncbi:MAG TPA: hypothetical protein VK673_04640 [Chthoniobacterales bacterium]|nr:hypothetical protein [Chthoniobacterales bacterium]